MGDLEEQFGKDAPAIKLVTYFNDNAKFLRSEITRLSALQATYTEAEALRDQIANYRQTAQVWEQAAAAATKLLGVPNLDPEKCDCGKGDYCPLWEHGMPSATALEMRNVRVAKRTRAESVEAARERGPEPFRSMR